MNLLFLRWLAARPSSRVFFSIAVLAGFAVGLSATRVVVAAELRQETYTWRNAKILGGGFVSGLIFHPTEPDLCYARTDVGGIYRWSAKTQSWLPLTDGLGASEGSRLGVLSLALDPQDARRIYFAGGSYTRDWDRPAVLFRSEDQGHTWAQTELSFRLGGNEDGRSAGERLQVDPRDGRILFLGTNPDGLWRSTDRAVTWKKVTSLEAESVTFVLFDPRMGETGQPTSLLYAGLNTVKGPSLFCSEDSGTTWRALTGQPAGLIPHHAVCDPQGVLYLSYANHLGPNGMTDGKIVRYDPRDRSWKELTPLAPASGDTFGYAGLSLDAQHPGTLLVSTMDRWGKHDEIFRTTDGGVTWRPLLAGAHFDGSMAPWLYWHRDPASYHPHWIGDVEIDPTNANRALFVTGEGLWATEDLDQADAHRPIHWTFRDEGLEETVPLALASPPSGPPLLSALGDIDGFRHDELEHSPPQGQHNPPAGTTRGIDFAENDPQLVIRLYEGKTPGAALSRDGGSTWTVLPLPTKGSPSLRSEGLSLSADGANLVWAIKDSPVFFSRDQGKTWSRSEGLPSVVSTRESSREPVADRVNPSRVYLYDRSAGKLYLSADGGAHFTVGAEQLPPKAGTLRAVPGAEGHLWLPSSTGLLFSADGGKHFLRQGNLENALQVGFGKPAPGNTYPALYLVGTSDGREGLFRSDDRGASWIMISDAEHRFGYIRAITGDPRIYGRVYLATGGRGIIYGSKE